MGIGEKYLKKMTQYKKFRIYADKLQRIENLLDFIINIDDLVEIMKEFQSIITQSFEEITQENLQQFIESWVTRFSDRESIISSVNCYMLTENLDVCLINQEECDNNIIFRDEVTTVEELLDHIKYQDCEVSHDRNFDAYKDLIEAESTPKNAMV